jgi:hypothetical protein
MNKECDICKYGWGTYAVETLCEEHKKMIKEIKEE